MVAAPHTGSACIKTRSIFSTGLLSKIFTSKFSGLSIIAMLFMAAAPADALDLRVAIEENAPAVRVGGSTTAVVRSATGQTLGRLQALGGNDAQATGGKVSIGPWTAQQVWIEPEGDGLVWIDDRWYRGRVLLVPNGSGITAVNYVDLEEYLYSVVASEMPPSWHGEALKAQAVAARSYAMQRRSPQKLYDVKDTTASQVYGGVAAETESTRSAVRETSEEVLTYNGQVIEAVFHSSSGGHTENSEHVWSSSRPYLQGVPDFDQEAPVFQWRKEFSAAQLRNKMIAKFGEDIADIGNLISFTPGVSSPHGRLRTLVIEGDRGRQVVPAVKVRQALGLRSTLFTVGTQLGSKASSSNFVFEGRGFGHGIGMSQYGARSLAEQGNTYEQILGHYYRNTFLSQIQ